MDQKQVAVDIFYDGVMLKLAREVAMDILPLEEILEINKISPDDWLMIKDHPHFNRLLGQELENWASALNTAERVKLKSMSFIEEALPEMYARIHDRSESLAAKVEMLKAVTKLAGMGGPVSVEGGFGERLVVNISLGADHKLKIEKEVTSKVIEGTATPTP